MIRLDDMLLATRRETGVLWFLGVFARAISRFCEF